MFLCDLSDQRIKSMKDDTCKVCTQEGIPNGYIAREEWTRAKLRRGEKHLHCEDCKRFNFKEQVRKPHRLCAKEVNSARKAFAARFAPIPRDKE